MVLDEEKQNTRFHLDAELASAMFQICLAKRQEAAVYIGVVVLDLLFLVTFICMGISLIRWLASVLRNITSTPHTQRTPEEEHVINSFWQEGRSIQESNLFMLEHALLCDVTLMAGKSREPVRAHRFMLASRNPVFFAVFLTESNRDAPVTVNEPDIEASTLMLLIRYIYTEKADLTGDNVLSLLYAARKYEVTSLLQKCRTFLERNIEPVNVCDILKHAVELNDDEITENCVNYVIKNGKKILFLDGFKTLSKDVLAKVIESNALCVDEDLVFTACIEWATHQCDLQRRKVCDGNIRKCLGDILYLIRFPTMPIETFTSIASRGDILTAEEKVAIFQNFSDASSYEHRFPANPRVNRH